MSAAHGDQIGIALAQPNELVRNTETVRQNLRKCRFMALADGLRAGDQRYRAILNSKRISTFSCGEPPVPLM